MDAMAHYGSRSPGLKVVLVCKVKIFKVADVLRPTHNTRQEQSHMTCMADERVSGAL